MIGRIGQAAHALVETEPSLEDVNAQPTTAKDLISKLNHAIWDHVKLGRNGVNGRPALLAADLDNAKELVSVILEPTDVKEKTMNLSNAAQDHVQSGLNGRIGDNALPPAGKEWLFVNVRASEEFSEITFAQDRKLNNALVMVDHALCGLHGRNGRLAQLRAEVE